MFTTKSEYLNRWLNNRKGHPCLYCNNILSNPVSIMCSKCEAHWRIHGSPTVKKPKLHEERDRAVLAVRKYDWSNSIDVFNEWLESFLSTGSHDPLKKLIHLHFKELTTNEGDPLMSFHEVLVQTLAVSLYLDEGGEVDEERNQNRYFLGRAAISPWGSSRQAAVGSYYDKKMRTTTQRQPKLFQRAFKVMLENTGILSILVRLRKEQKEVLER